MDSYRFVLPLLLIWAVGFATPQSLAQDEPAAKDEPSAHKERKTDRPPPRRPRGERRKPPLLLDNKNDECLVTVQEKYCLGGKIDEQLKKTPAQKYATYGLRDVYLYQNPKGGSTVLYVVNEKISNVLVRFAPPPERKARKGGHRMNANRGLIRGIFGTVNRYANKTGHAREQQDNRVKAGKVLRGIDEKGRGSYSWDFDRWQFYFELTNKGKITTEAWVPELEKLEKNAVKLKPGNVLTGSWHNKHPVEMTLDSKDKDKLMGNVRFKKLQKGLYQNKVEIQQNKSGKFNLVRYVEDGSRQVFISQKPKGNAKGCYVWLLSIQDKDNPQSYKHDGSLQLCP